MEQRQRFTHRIHTRITAKKLEELQSLQLRSQGIKSLSELLRNILDNKKIVVLSRDASLDMLMEELSKIRQQIQAIGVNINQVTKRFHNASGAEAKLFSAMEITRLYQQTDLKVTELLGIISNLSKVWLPGS